MGLQRRVQNLAVGGESRQEEPNRRSYHRFGCGAVLGSPLLLPLAILRRAPSPSLAAELGSLGFGRDGSTLSTCCHRKTTALISLKPRVFDGNFPSGRRRPNRNIKIN